MERIRQNQTALKITAIVNQDITGYQSAEILYKSPNGTIGSWTADIENLITGAISFKDFQKETLEEIGIWTFCGEIKFSDGKVASGDPFEIQVYSKFDNK